MTKLVPTLNSNLMVTPQTIKALPDAVRKAIAQSKECRAIVSQIRGKLFRIPLTGKKQELALQELSNLADICDELANYLHYRTTLASSLALGFQTKLALQKTSDERYLALLKALPGSSTYSSIPELPNSSNASLNAAVDFGIQKIMDLEQRALNLAATWNQNVRRLQHLRTISPISLKSICIPDEIRLL